MPFYFDGTGWVHKTNSVQTGRTRRKRMWRKRVEKLNQECGAKGKKEGTAGRIAKCFVAIAYGKPVIGCHQDEGHVNGEMFSEFAREHFPELFQRGNNNCRKLFIQDGDSPQNSRLSEEVFNSFPCCIFKITIPVTRFESNRKFLPLSRSETSYTIIEAKIPV